MIKKVYLVIFCLITISSIYGQTKIDLSANSQDSNIKIKGTYISIDTMGLNLVMSENPRVFFNESDQTVFAIEQKQISIDEYESVIGMMLKFDTIYKEEKVVFKDFSGKLYLGKMNIQNSDKDFWMCYLGNDEFVLEIKGFYNSELQSKYKSSFEQTIKSLYIEVSEDMSIYDDLPFYLDETKFPYKKDYSLMPESISISREVDGHARSVMLTYIKITKEDLEAFKSEFEADAEKKLIDNKEIIFSITEADENITLQGLIIMEDQLINITCFSSTSDTGAIQEFKAITESIIFRN